MMYKIQNGSILIDKKDKEVISKFKWYISANGYVLGNNGTTKNRKTHYLHRFLLNVKGRKIQVDHINRNKLDNRRANLRLCTQQQNSGNMKQPKGKLGKGVRKASRSSRFIAVIKVGGKSIYAGTFDTVQEAKDAYDKIALEWFGPFALTNKMIDRKVG